MSLFYASYFSLRTTHHVLDINSSVGSSAARSKTILLMQRAETLFGLCRSLSAASSSTYESTILIVPLSGVSTRYSSFSRRALSYAGDLLCGNSTAVRRYVAAPHATCSVSCYAVVCSMPIIIIRLVMRSSLVYPSIQHMAWRPINVFRTAGRYSPTDE